MTTGGDYPALIERAGALLRPHRLDDHRFAADVSCIVVSARGDEFTGVCIDVPSGSLCAEQSAIAAMVTAGQYQIRLLVAVTRIGSVLQAIAPCGKCREFLRQVDESNLGADVVLGPERAATLRDLLPETDWPG